jgi:glycosyltransferase involved in cell wall biosynthesis
VRLGARLSHRAERVIYVAQTSALQHEALGYRADKRVILPNGFDTGRFAPCDDARLQLRHDLGLAPSTVLIGSIARYHPMKDHANFLRAAHECVRAHPDTHFVLAGDRVDPSNVTLARLVDSLGLASRAHLLGRRDDAPHVLAGLDIATSASYSEAFPNVIGEAMACGVPCVVTDVGDSALVVGETGRTVPPRQPRALARAWADLIELGRNGRVAMGQTARRRIVEHYGLRSVVSRYERLYEDLAGRRPGPVGQATDVGSGAARNCLE